MYLNFLDFETTDKNPVTAEILTGYVETYHESDIFNMVDCLYVECRPELYLESSYPIHKISRDRAMAFPDSNVGMRSFFKHLIKYPSTVVCHANELVFGVRGYFDWQVLRSYCAQRDKRDWFYKKFGDYKVVSTHGLAKERLPGIGGYSLEKLAQYYKITYEAHNCIQDTKTMIRIYRELILNNRSLFDFMEEPNVNGSKSC